MKQFQVPFFNLWPRLSDGVKAAVSLLLIFPWTLISKALVPDSYLGVAIVLVPDAAFLVAALVFVSNGLARNIK
jgi:hypothetical protein